MIDGYLILDKMANQQREKIVVKVGTNVLTNDKGFIDEKVVKNLVGQAVKANKAGWDVVLVSSGSVGAGRSLIKLNNNTDSIIKRQVLAAAGQVELVNIYTKYFSKYNLQCSQLLVTKEDFRDRRHYLNIKNCLNGLMRHDIFPIINENDAVAVNELMFTDNDELAVLVASMIDAKHLIILTDVDGVFKGCPVDGKGEIIKEIEPSEESLPLCEKPNQKSKLGRGGILTKVAMAQKAANLGITTYVANGKKKNIIADVLDKKAVCTTFLPKRRASSLKRWVANARGHEKGSVRVNRRAEEVLTSREKIASLLPVGVVEVEGDFAKGDIIKIKNETGDNIGMGVAQYDCGEAKKIIGQKGVKPLVRYDYLYLEK